MFLRNCFYSALPCLGALLELPWLLGFQLLMKGSGKKLLMDWLESLDCISNLLPEFLLRFPPESGLVFLFA